MSWLQQSAPSERMLAGFIVASLAAVVIAFAFRMFDHSRFVSGDDARAAEGGFFSYPDHALLILVLGFVGLTLVSFLGWRIPQEIERLHGSGGDFRVLAPEVTMTTLGRAAQVLGAVCFGLLALRFFRPVVFLGLLVLLAVLGVLAFGYVFP